MNNNLWNLRRDFTTYTMWVANDWRCVEEYGRAYIGMVASKKVATLKTEQDILESWRLAMRRHATSRRLLAETRTVLEKAGVNTSQLPTERVYAGCWEDRMQGKRG
ncbi:MAG: hypothetical protein WAZ18_03930 [Alphaproteobacteria bacterium]